jgi:hypothetical protein
VVSPSQRRLLENLHEVPRIRFLKSASSTSPRYSWSTTLSMSSSSSTSITFDCINCLTISSVQLHRLVDYIDDVSFLFSFFSEVNLMIGYWLIYQTYHELFVNYNFLVLVWIWLHVCLSYDSCLGLVKLILYHVNFVRNYSCHVYKIEYVIKN